MKKTLLSLFLLLTAATASAQMMLDTLGTVRYFTLTDGQMMAIPERYIIERTEDNRALSLKLAGDTTIVIQKRNIASESTDFHCNVPEITSFKFNNKFNDQLYADAIGTIDQTQSRIDVELSCIGQRLAPSIQKSEGAELYVNGIHQESKRSRQRFDKPVTYTVAYPKNWVYVYHQTSEEVWSQPDFRNPDVQWWFEDVPLNEWQVLTNAPSNFGEDPYYLLDDDPNTFFHSTWGNGDYTPLTWYEGATYGDGVSEWPYLGFYLYDEIKNFKFSYTLRNDIPGYGLLSFIVQGSNDGQAWEDIRTFTAERDGLPTEQGGSYESPIIGTRSYKYLKLQLTSSQKANYLVLSSFRLTKATINPDYEKAQAYEPTLLSPATYGYEFVPLGREYKVHVLNHAAQSTTQYGVPILRINTYFGYMPYDRETYLDASLEIDGAGVFPDLKLDSIQIRGRGNSSWGHYYDKNPYRLKFPQKEKPFGLTKGKNWVLLANKQTNSMTSNAVAMKIADMVESPGCCHIIPVELYMNGEYRGSYNFTEKVGFHNNNIDIDDETSAVLLELDSYYDEAYKFKTTKYSLPVNIKEPEFDDPACSSVLTFDTIKTAFNQLCADVYSTKNAHSSALIDVESLCRSFFVIDLTRNTEICHPKSFFVFCEDLRADSVTWKFGPVWDFDWSFGYEGYHTYFINDATGDLFNAITDEPGNLFFKHLMRYHKGVRNKYAGLWKEFMEGGGLDDLLDYCDDYYKFCKESFAHNANVWGDGLSYATTTTNAKTWLTKRANYLYNRYIKDYTEGDIDIADEEPFGQPDRINVNEVFGQPVDIYTLGGIRVRSQVPLSNFSEGLAPGIYIVNGEKVLVR